MRSSVGFCSEPVKPMPSLRSRPAGDHAICAGGGKEARGLRARSPADGPAALHPVVGLGREAGQGAGLDQGEPLGEPPSLEAVAKSVRGRRRRGVSQGCQDARQGA